MLSEMERLELEIRLKKQEATRDEFKLQKLRLMQKADKLDSEVALQENSINEIKQKLGV
jgi:hypothetical protein